MSEFELKQPYRPAGDQPEAIKQLTEHLAKGDKFLTLLGATGTGKTYTMAHVIQNVKKPTLVIAHNKTLAAQLCNEFREFFPDNAVEYFVSYYDYYQPEAYIAKSDTYIEKEAQINEEIDRLRHSATQALLTRKDVIICASVSCIYGLGAPEAYALTTLHIETGNDIKREEIVSRLVDMQFTRTNADLERGSFRLTGQVLEIMPANEEKIFRIETAGGHVERILRIDPVTRKTLSEPQELWVFPAKHFITPGPEREKAIKTIRTELKERLELFEKNGKLLEAERLERRTNFDLEMIENLGYCNGIENYSRHLSGRAPGDPPDTLFSYFPKDFLLMIDESHVTIPQIGGMYEGDKSRKDTLVEHGFRLPSAKDNRPLTFKEFEDKVKQAVFVSATPGPFEFKHSASVVEQIIRPTGLIDPEVIIRPITQSKQESSKHEPDLSTPSNFARDDGGGMNQIDDCIASIIKATADGNRTLVTTLTKKMAEDLTEYLKEKKIKACYLHSDIKTVERLEILSDFRRGKYDALVGVNLLREGLDLPEVSLVCILDADKEGFLRSDTSLIQTIGRAARNVQGQVILYADHVTGSMKRAIAETDRRRKKQVAYNQEHGITPKTIRKAIVDLRGSLGFAQDKDIKEILKLELSAETRKLEEVIKQKEAEMKSAALELDFELATILRDEIVVIKQELGKRQKKSPLKTMDDGGKASPSIKRPPRHGRTRN
ncbi:MAG: excinuclease ABC subunit UvrB [Patescibacteria group bacterium]|nr:excinuclease ABC subunit UvrB [Patescibacteria group bacterium]